MKGKIRKILSLILTFGLLYQQIGFAQVAAELNVAGYFSKLSANTVQDKFRPLQLRYFSYDTINDSFKVLLDKGDVKKLDDLKAQESTKVLLSYFLIGVSLPDSKFWVNLRPDAQDQIIDPALEKTDIGKIMLEADLQLKKDTASFTSPQTTEGRQYWTKLYQKAAQIYGYENVNIPTLTRPWIVPGEIIIRGAQGSAYIYKANLKVMLEQDYLKNSSAYNFQDNRAKALNEYSSQLIRELIIPKLTKEINSSARYAPLRQVYYSLVLARWFKTRFTGQTGTYSSLINTQNLASLTSKESWSKSVYFKQYQKSFAEGEYNVKEPVYTPTGQVIRSYFSGGVDVTANMKIAGFSESITASGQVPSIPNAVILTDQASNILKNGSSPAVVLPVIANKNFELLRKIPEAVKSLADKDLTGQRVLIRVNMNVKSKKGLIDDTARLDAVSEVVKFVLSKGATPILYGHNGRLDKKKNKDERQSLEDASNYIKTKYFPDVVFHKGSITENGLQIKKDDIKLGVTNILENVRFADEYELGSKKKEFAQSLIDLSDGIFIFDGFGDTGSSGASVENVPLLAKEVYTGPAMVKEFNVLEGIMEGFDALIFGGAKLEKADLLDRLVNAIKPSGFALIGSGISPTLNGERKEFLEKLRADNSERVITALDYLDSDNTFDIGPQTIKKFLEKLDTLGAGQTIVYNGTMGYMEHESGRYQAGTKVVMDKLIELAQRGVRIICIGGDAGSTAKKYGLDKQKNVVTFTGGGVPLDILANETLVGLEALATRQQQIVSAPVTQSVKSEKSNGPRIMFFGDYGKNNEGLPKGSAKLRGLLGGKGANLAEMALLANKFAEKYGPKLKLNIPPGFTVTTEETKAWRERRENIKTEGMALTDIVHQTLGDELTAELIKSIKLLEEVMGKKFGDKEHMPLLIAVRSGSKESMPGMMDTILNLGLNDEVVKALVKATNERFAWDAYRRFVEMFGKTVLEVEDNENKRTGFKYILQQMCKDKEVKDEYGLQAEDFKKLVGLYKAEIIRQGKPTIPEDPMEQYFMAVYTVMKSSFNDRAMAYRKKSGLKLEDTLSAVNILPMIFGNMNAKSGSGVAFSRNLQNGKKEHNLEFNVNCQGEDVVSGRKKGLSIEELRNRFPDVAENLEAILEFLESEFKDIQDTEFTFEYNEAANKITLWILQTRNAKRSAVSEVRAAVEMVKEGLITKEKAVERITPDKIAEELLVPQFDKENKTKALKEGRLLTNGGLNASPGAGTGIIVFDSTRAKELKARIDSVKVRVKAGEKVNDEERYLVAGVEKVDLTKVEGIILCREETSPEDLDGMLASNGILTARGGRTSHAAVVARQFGIPAVVGDENIEINFEKRTVRIKKIDGTEAALTEGDMVSLDGTGEGGKGQLFAGKIETTPSLITVAQYRDSLGKVRTAVELLEKWKGNAADKGLINEYNKHIKIYQEHVKKYENMELTPEEKEFYAQYQELQGWASEIRKENKGLGVGANSEKALDVLNATLNGAENFGLVRTEHMFSGGGRELAFQEFILAKTEAARINALEKILPFQQVDFEQIYIFAAGRPVTIRLIDPPLHEFLPRAEDKIKELADHLNLSVEEVKNRIEALHEENPMFGTRGCRLSILFPELIEMQTKAILNAVDKVNQAGIKVSPQIMIPLVGNVEEFEFVKKGIEKVAQEQKVERKSFMIGTMIEIVAGAQNIAGIVRAGAEFISFGTNDLTQGVVKISRDDGKEWLRMAQATGIFEDDPSATLSPEVAEVIKRVIEGGRAVNPKLKVGICGEQGLDIKSIKKYLAGSGLDYVSGSPRRNPGALICAAQKAKENKDRRFKYEAKPKAQEQGSKEVVIVNSRSEIEPILLKDIRFDIQEFLLNKGVDKATLSKNLAIFEKFLVKHPIEMAKKGEALSVRLLDLPLGDFFKYETEAEFDAVVEKLAQNLGISIQEAKERIKKYAEANSAIGTRGMRAYLLKDIAPLYIAIAESALISAQRNESKVVDISLPFLVNGKELEVILNGFNDDKGETLVPSLRKSLEKIKKDKDTQFRFGAIIETPSACITAKDMAKNVDFLVIDVKKLTEAVWAAFEKDAKAGFSDAYLKEGVWGKDIFKYAPKEVDGLILEAISSAREQNPNIEIRMIVDPADTDLVKRLGLNPVLPNTAFKVQDTIKPPRPGDTGEYGYMEGIIFDVYVELASKFISPQQAAEKILIGILNMPEPEYIVNLATAVSILARAQEPKLDPIIKIILRYEDKGNHAWLQNEVKLAIRRMLREEEFRTIELQGLQNNLKEFEQHVNFSIASLRKKFDRLEQSLEGSASSSIAESEAEIKAIVAAQKENESERFSSSFEKLEQAYESKLKDLNKSFNAEFIRIETEMLRQMFDPDTKKGGIDFRALPMSIQPMGSFKGLNFSLPQLSQVELRQINIGLEMQQIKNMVRSGITPSGERIKEFIAACVQKGEIDARVDNLLLCLMDVCKLEEGNASESSSALKEALVIVNTYSGV